VTIVATMPPVAATPTEVTCEDCDEVIKPGARASCFACSGEAIVYAEEEARADERKAHEPAQKAIREWAHRRFLMGQITREVRAELELCADDIEVGHG
jgi:hypothetical protein